MKRERQLPGFRAILLAAVLFSAAAGLVARPAAAQPSTVYGDEVTVNLDGADCTQNGSNPGLCIVVGNAGLYPYRNNLRQTSGSERFSYALIVEGGANGYQISRSGSADYAYPTFIFESSNRSSWSTTSVELLEDGPERWVVEEILTKNLTDIGTYTMKIETTYVTPQPWVDQRVTVTPPAGRSAEMQLYLGADLRLDDVDRGPGNLETLPTGRLVYQYDNSPGRDVVVAGVEMPGSEWASYILANYNCYKGDDHIPDCEDELSQGPYKANPYLNYVNPNDTMDAGMGLHWELGDATQARSVDVRLYFGPYSQFISDRSFLPVIEDETTEPVERVCELTPDMAVSPQFITLAPGGTAQVEVALRNLCNDAPYRNSDLLVSLSDGLRVVDGSAGLVNLGQRAAWQGFDLAPAETRRFLLTVSAGTEVLAAPVHISELYNLGRVVQRIDGVFIMPAPAAVEPAAAPVPVEPAVPAVPAPLPTALPNTAGETTTAWWLGAGLVLLLAGAGSLRLRRG
jgi:LPXTG-motif cell wall-anchored protein